MTNDTLVKGSLLKGDDLIDEYKKRKKTTIRKSIPIEQDIPEGWDLKREYVHVKHITKEKRIGKKLENKVWRLFYVLGVESISTRDFTLQIRKKSDLQKTKQVDVVALDEDFVFIVECKAKKVLGKRSLKKDIAELKVNKREIEYSLRRILDNRDITFVNIIATENIEWDENDKLDAKEAGFLVWDEYDLMVLRDLANLAGEGAKYQVYNKIFHGRQIKGFDKKIPALKSTMGRHTFYTFNLAPADLLKIAFVQRRTPSTNFNNITQAYQRVIKKYRIRRIEDFIENGGIFPGSVIINFHKNFPKEEIIGSKNQREQLDQASEPVAITLPPYYGCAWIIDGQHRLYGYSDIEEKYSETLPIVAFVDKDVSFEANLFVEINKNQKSIGSNLLWDLYEDLYAGSEDEKELELWVISKLAKKLNSNSNSPFKGCIKIPKDQNQGDMTLTTICSTIKRLGIVSKGDGLLYKDTHEKTIDFAYARIATYFNIIRGHLPEQWERGNKHYIRTNAGFVVFTGLLLDILNNLQVDEINDLEEFKKFADRFIEPVLVHLLYAEPEEIDAYRGAGGAIQKSRQVRIEFLKKIRDAGVHFRSRWLEKIEEAKKEEDEFEKKKKGIKYYLEKDESEVIEFKGSLSFDIDRYLLGDGKQQENPKLIDEGVLKTIVAFLNTRGGTILVGVLEQNKYEQVYKEKLDDYPIVDNKIIFGIQHEYSKDEWDGYYQKLINLIESRISPEVLDLEFVEISKFEEDDFDICLIEVTPSDTKQYLNNKDFYKRRGNKTQKLTGKQIDNYWNRKG